MKKELKYSTKYWEEEKDLLITNVQKDQTFIVKNLDRFVRRLKNHEKFNVINSYCTLSSAYVIYAKDLFFYNNPRKKAIHRRYSMKKMDLKHLVI